MLNDLLFLSLPLVISGIAHMIIVRLNLFSILKKPINIKLFGENKTYRGFVIMPLISIFSVYITIKIISLNQIVLSFNFEEYPFWLTGFLMGIFYCLFELPNSWIKRRLGIQPGKLPEKKKLLFALTDQADSVIGCSLLFYNLFNFSFLFTFYLILFGSSLHLFINYLLYLCKIRKNPL